MLMQIFAIYDSKAEVYNKPFYELTIASAIRAFSDAANDTQTAFAKHPADYTLFHIGTFDDATAKIDLNESFNNLGNCLEHIQPQIDNNQKLHEVS